MKSVSYPYAEFRHCNPDVPDDQFTLRVSRYARSLSFLLKQRAEIEAGTSDFFAAEEALLGWLRMQHSALVRVTRLRCTTVDDVLDDGDATAGWSLEGYPTLVGVALQIEQVVNPDLPQAQKILSRSCDIFAANLSQSTRQVTVYDSRDSERLSLSAIRNSTLMDTLAAATLEFNHETLSKATATEPIPTPQIEERIHLLREQRERSIHSGLWMLASANFGAYPMQQVRRTLLDLALNSDDADAARDIVKTALHGSRSELIAFAECIAGPLG